MATQLGECTCNLNNTNTTGAEQREARRLTWLLLRLPAMQAWSSHPRSLETIPAAVDGRATLRRGFPFRREPPVRRLDPLPVCGRFAFAVPVSSPRFGSGLAKVTAEAVCVDFVAMAPTCPPQHPKPPKNTA